MKKATVVLLLVIQIALLFIFQNIYALFKKYQEVGIADVKILMQNMEELQKMFSVLSMVLGLTLAVTGIYLLFLIKKSKENPEYNGIPPLHDYLLQLKTSESELKSIVETQQEKVVQKEELNKNIINNIDAAVIFLNNSGRVEIFNTVAETLFSQSYANAKNNRLDKVLGSFPGLCEFVESHQNRQETEEITSNDRIFRTHINPIDQIGVLLIIRDITEEKKREELDRRNSNFVMLGEMTAFLAHEVKNSLGVIYGYTKTIKTEEEKTGKISKEILFLTDMMESFLNFSRPVTLAKKEPIDLAVLVQKIAIEKGVTVVASGDPVVLENDPSLIQSIFANLILNSQQAGADKIEVIFKKGRDLEIYLKDNGSGIDPRIREKIWYPFFTTKAKGTGMGLPSIRKIINFLKGEILLVETGPEGTTFKIIFYSR
ncbi:MAG TPA: ATP-binding protein [Candidatus Deferrimicrobium sp.]|nr:ATP-binding protein [Candidatus Deferrimicrobium sp.]